MSTKYEIMKDHHQIIAESCVVPFSNRHSIICTAIIVIVVHEMINRKVIAGHHYELTSGYVKISLWARIFTKPKGL